MKEKDQPLKEKIPTVNYETIEKIILYKGNGLTISNISKHIDIPPEIVHKIISDYYQSLDLRIELLSSIDCYTVQSQELQDLLVQIRKNNKDDDKIKYVKEMMQIHTVLHAISEKKFDVLAWVNKNQQTRPIPRLVPTEKQKEIIDILMKLGSADKRTIAEMMKVSETRVYHLLHGKNGKQCLINRFLGLSCKKQGNKNIYQLEYQMVKP